jgi:hypothetical protein
MKKARFFLSVLLAISLVSCKSATKVSQSDKPGIEIRDESQQPLSYFNVYKGNTHSHTILTWTHGEHRKELIKELDKPTPFKPGFATPPGTDWRDEKTLNLDPQYYPASQGLPANHLALAKENGYDFYAITDHCQEPTLNPVSPDNWAWKNIKAACDKYLNDPKFVAIPGIEFSRNTQADGGQGHINVLNAATYINADHGQRGSAPAWPEANWSVAKFYGWVKSDPAPYDGGPVVVGFNHPAKNQYADFGNYDPEIAKRISTFELHTNYSMQRWAAYIHCLNKGWKVSPIGVHDNHGYSAILNKEKFPPTLVLAPKLTREEILKALHERRTFVSYIQGTELKYSANGHIMGSTLKNSDKFSFKIEVKTPADEKSTVRRIQILKNNSEGKDDVEVVAEATFDGTKDFITWAPEVPDASARYFIVRVHHGRDIAEDGSFKANGSSIAAPVWIERQ